jgi:hypothetical protein
VVAPLVGGVVLESCGPKGLGLACAALSLTAALPLAAVHAAAGAARAEVVRPAEEGARDKAKRE